MIQTSGTCLAVVIHRHHHVGESVLKVISRIGTKVTQIIVVDECRPVMKGKLVEERSLMLRRSDHFIKGKMSNNYPSGFLGGGSQLILSQVSAS